jgi:hypothetical protein
MLNHRYYNPIAIFSVETRQCLVETNAEEKVLIEEWYLLQADARENQV